jgi:ABC-type phosphate transport system substrate-binding protein
MRHPALIATPAVAGKTQAMTPRMVRLSMLLVLAFLLSSLALPTPLVAAEGYKVIVHSSNPATSLSRDEVMRYFLKRSASWPQGMEVVAVDLEKDSQIREAFSRDVLRKSVAAVTAYWQQQIFSGRSVPPPEKRGSADVVAFVEGHAGGIGYVAASDDVGNAKVVRLVD